MQCLFSTCLTRFDSMLDHTWEAAGRVGALRRADGGARPVLRADVAGRLALLAAGPVGCPTLALAGVLSSASSAENPSSAGPSSP